MMRFGMPAKPSACRRSLLWTVLLFCVVLENTAAQVKPQEDFDGYMQQKQRQEAEEAAYRNRLAEHEVSSDYCLRRCTLF
jgi:hypothetical protein